jgi:pimeloyl-ACP methyl ester carboxylesterase
MFYAKRNNVLLKNFLWFFMTIFMIFLFQGMSNAQEKAEKQRISTSLNKLNIPLSIGPSNEYIEMSVRENGEFTMGITGGPILLYGHPSPWTSATTVRIDGTDYWNYGGNQWGTVITPPYVEGDSNITKWLVSGNIELTQILDIAYSSYSEKRDVIGIKYTVKNVDTISHNVGIRVMLDTMLANNDGAPFKIPGIGNVTSEMDFLGNNVPIYWQAFDSLTNPTVQSQGTLISGGLAPDRFVIAAWPRINDSPWDFSVSPATSITGDSAVGIYWNPTLLRPGESRTYITYYGLGAIGINTEAPLTMGIAAPNELLRQNTGPSFIPTDSLFPNPFTVNAYLENSSPQISETVTGITAEIILPPELELASGNLQQAVSSLDRGQSTQVSWDVMIAETDMDRIDGNLDYTIRITTAQGNKEIVNSIYVPHWLTVGIKVWSHPHDWTVGRQIEFSADVHGNQTGEDISYAWDFNEDGQWGDETGQTVFISYEMARTYVVGLKATNEITGAIAIHRIYISIVTPPNLFEPSVVPAVDIIPGVGVDSSGSSFVFDMQNKENGLIIITHGLTGSGRDVWLSDMKREIQDTLYSTPNICLYDWQDMANPCSIQGSPCLISFIDKFPLVRVYGLAEGLILADWIRTQIDAENIDSSAKIHIIGHSAGGFVAESCAAVLGDVITQITMLDTPFPPLNYGLNYLEVGGNIDAYISQYGNLSDEFLMTSVPNRWQSEFPSQVHWTNIKSIVEGPDYPGSDHSDAYKWYINTCKVDSTIDDGFYYSPWLEQSFPTMSSQFSKASEIDKKNDLQSTQNVPIETFEVFGNVEEVNEVYTISEGTGNSGIFKTVNFPTGAQNVIFKYKFISQGDGDFLSVHLKDSTDSDTLLYIGPNLPISRENYINGEVNVSTLAGKSGQLIFKLVKRGEQNTVLSIDSIEMQVLEEDVHPPNGGGGGGGAPVGPLAVGLSSLLSWLKRRKKKS